MKDDPNKNHQRGVVNYVWVLGGGYLLYTAFQLFRRLFSGEADSAAINILGGGFFAVVGALMLLREWKAYQYGKAHINDPESWSDEPEEDETIETTEPEALPEDAEEDAR